MWAMINKRVGDFFIVLLATVCITPVFAADYVHTSMSGIIAIRTEQRLIAVGDVAVDATFCEPKSGLICFQSKDFRFAIPITVNDRTAWLHDGESYSGRKIDETLFGRAGPYWLVRQKRSHGFEFLFSDQYGLVVIQSGTESPGSYVLMQPCGFASAPDCR